MRQHLIHQRGRNPQLAEQGAQRLARFDLQNFPIGARRQLLAARHQRRQRQCQRGMAGKRFVDRVGKARNDRGNQRADRGEQAGMDPMATCPTVIECRRKMRLELAMQCSVVEDVEAFLKAPLACTALL